MCFTYGDFFLNSKLIHLFKTRKFDFAVEEQLNTMHTTFSIQSMFVIFFFYIYSSSISTQITHLMSSQFINGFSCCKHWPCCIYTMTGSGCQSVLLLPPRKRILLYFMSISDTVCEVCPLPKLRQNFSHLKVLN